MKDRHLLTFLTSWTAVDELEMLLMKILTVHYDEMKPWRCEDRV